MSYATSPGVGLMGEQTARCQRSAREIASTAAALCAHALSVSVCRTYLESSAFFESGTARVPISCSNIRSSKKGVGSCQGPRATCPPLPRSLPRKLRPQT